MTLKSYVLLIFGLNLIMNLIEGPTCNHCVSSISVSFSCFDVQLKWWEPKSATEGNMCVGKKKAKRFHHGRENSAILNFITYTVVLFGSNIRSNVFFACFLMLIS